MKNLILHLGAASRPLSLWLSFMALFNEGGCHFFYTFAKFHAAQERLTWSVRCRLQTVEIQFQLCLRATCNLNSFFIMNDIETSTVKLAELLRHPEDLDKIPALKSEFTRKKAAIDSQ